MTKALEGVRILDMTHVQSGQQTFPGEGACVITLDITYQTNAIGIVPTQYAISI